MSNNIAVTAASLVETQALSRHLDPPHSALAGLTLSVRGGEVCCLLGSPQSGNATALRIVAGMLRPDNGSCSVVGVQIAKDPLAARQFVTFATRKAAVYKNMTGRQNVLFFARLASPTVKARTIDIDNAMRRAGVPEKFFDTRTADAPRDVRLKLWLALAWVRNCSVVALEDPTYAVDAAAVSGIVDAIGDLRTAGKAVLIATPDMFLAGHTADHVWIMARGRQIECRPGAALLASSLNELYTAYAGRSGAQTGAQGPGR